MNRISDSAAARALALRAASYAVRAARDFTESDETVEVAKLSPERRRALVAIRVSSSATKRAERALSLSLASGDALSRLASALRLVSVDYRNGLLSPAEYLDSVRYVAEKFGFPTGGDVKAALRARLSDRGFRYVYALPAEK